jgi:hypothetical protein
VPKEICSIEECDKPEHAKKLCQPHYRQANRRARGLQKPGPKPEPSKPYSRYNYEGLSHHTKGEKCSRGHEYVEGSYKVRSDGTRVCVRCFTEGFVSDALYGYRIIEKSRDEISWRRTTYALSDEDFSLLLELQDNKCLIGKHPFKDNSDICVDHNHECCPTDKTCGNCVRGLLCRRHNSGLGMFNDNADELLDAVEYLQKYKNRKTLRR